MYKGIIIAMALLICFSCGAPKVATTTDVQKDSVSVVIKESIEYRDTTIYVEVPVEVFKEILPDTDTSHLETSLAISEAWVYAGMLNHSLVHKDVSLEKKVEVPEKTTQKDSISISQKEVVEEVPVEVEKPLTAWQNFRMVVGSLALMAIAVWALIKIIKKYFIK
jgi:uncharacterized protein YjaG (DUF416 family)